MIADHYLQLRSDLETALAELLKLGSQLRRAPEALEAIHGLLADIREPLLFVAVGEVKSGKSSLLNALFGQELAKVDVLPATDKICIFRFGSEEKGVQITPKLTERHLPIAFLHDFNVVDTPGTNTMVKDHQAITENFIPRADVVLFVFSVVNPWSQSAWDFLEFVQRKWLKNIVFVLQQADLRDAREIDIIHRHLLDTATQKLGFAPPIFPVSARKALLARTTAVDKERLWEESRFGDLQNQINLIVSESGTRMEKLRSARQTARVIVDDIISGIKESIDLIARDEARLQKVELFLQARQEQTRRQIVSLVRGVESACRQCTAQGSKLLSEKLSLWRTWQILWSRKQWERDFQMQIEMKLRQNIEPQVEQAVQQLESDLRGLWPQLQDMLETLLEKELRSRIPKTLPDLPRQRRELLQGIHLALIEKVSGRSIEEQLAQLFRETSGRLRVPAGVAAAGGLITVIAAMSSAAVADVTGVLALTALVASAVVASTQRSKILNAYQTQMDSKCAELTQAIEQQLDRAVDQFYREIAAAFQPLEALCVAQRRQVEPVVARAEELKKKLDQMAERLG